VHATRTLITATHYIDTVMS